MKYKRHPETISQNERTRVAGLRRRIPPTPEGWVSRPKGIRRLNDKNAEGLFGQAFVSGDLRLCFVALPPTDRVQYSVSRNGGVPEAADIKRIRAEWFPGKMMETTAPLGGVVYLRITDAN